MQTYVIYHSDTSIIMANITSVKLSIEINIAIIKQKNEQSQDIMMKTFKQNYSNRFKFRTKYIS